MYKDDIEELNKWFADKERAYKTGFNGEEYVVSEVDVIPWYKCVRHAVEIVFDKDASRMIMREGERT